MFQPTGNTNFDVPGTCNNTLMVWEELPQISPAHPFVLYFGNRMKDRPSKLQIRHLFPQNMAFTLHVFWEYWALWYQTVSYLQIVTFTLSYKNFPMESVHANQNKLSALKPYE
jgi:hypothetical protein